MKREQKIQLLKKLLKGEKILDAYVPTSAFLKAGNEYFNDGYRWSVEEFTALQQKLQTPPWLPSIWFIDVDEYVAFSAWLVNNCKPISERVPGVVEDCTTEFENRLQEFGSDGVYYF